MTKIKTLIKAKIRKQIGHHNNQKRNNNLNTQLNLNNS